MLIPSILFGCLNILFLDHISLILLLGLFLLCPLLECLIKLLLDLILYLLYIYLSNRLLLPLLLCQLHFFLLLSPLHFWLLDLLFLCNRLLDSWLLLGNCDDLFFVRG